MIAVTVAACPAEGDGVTASSPINSFKRFTRPPAGVGAGQPAGPASGWSFWLERERPPSLWERPSRRMPGRGGVWRCPWRPRRGRDAGRGHPHTEPSRCTGQVAGPGRRRPGPREPGVGFLPRGALGTSTTSRRLWLINPLRCLRARGVPPPEGPLLGVGPRPSCRSPRRPVGGGHSWPAAAFPTRPAREDLGEEREGCLLTGSLSQVGGGEERGDSVPGPLGQAGGVPGPGCQLSGEGTSGNVSWKRSGGFVRSRRPDGRPGCPALSPTV